MVNNKENKVFFKLNKSQQAFYDANRKLYWHNFKNGRLVARIFMIKNIFSVNHCLGENFFKRLFKLSVGERLPFNGCWESYFLDNTVSFFENGALIYCRYSFR